jgi:methionyl aminopeptidase
MVGDVDDRGKALVECTKETLDKAIAISGPNVPLLEVGRVIW